MQFILSLSLLILISSVHAVDALIITKDGASIVAYKVDKTGAKVNYSGPDGSRKSMDVARLYQILPKVVRGQTYQPTTVKKNIRYAYKAKAKFPNLRKQVQVVLDEWLAVRRQFKELTPEAKAEMKKTIEKLFTEYESSPKTNADFSNLRGQLEMIRYKDLQGVFEDDIDARLEGISKVFIANIYKAIKQRCSKERITAEEFTEIKGLAKEHRAFQPPPEQLNDVKTLLPMVQKKCLTAEHAAARDSFKKSQDMETYLAANARLTLLLQHVAEEGQKPTIERTRKKMQAALKSYDFRFGYPLSKSDIKILGKIGTYSSTELPETYPYAVIFPSERIASLDIRKKQKIRIYAIFGRKPPEGIMGLEILPYKINVWSPTTKRKRSRAAVSFSTETLQKLGPPKNDDGTKATALDVRLILRDPKNKDTKPIILSNYFRFSVAP